MTVRCCHDMQVHRNICSWLSLNVCFATELNVTTELKWCVWCYNNGSWDNKGGEVFPVQSFFYPCMGVFSYFLLSQKYSELRYKEVGCLSVQCLSTIVSPLLPKPIQTSWWKWREPTCDLGGRSSWPTESLVALIHNECVLADLSSRSLPLLLVFPGNFYLYFI